MSNYIMLIMYAYNEKGKEKKIIKPKINFFCFLEENRKFSIVLIMALISLIFYITVSFIKIEHSGLYQAISLIIYIILLIILIPLSEKVNQKNYKKIIKAHDLRMEILRDVLKNDFRLYESGKIQELIKQCDMSIKSYKLSTEIFKPLVDIAKSVLFPIVTFSFGLIIKKVEISVDDTIRITKLVIVVIVMFFGLFLIVKNPVESFLDSQSNKIKELKNMLEDIFIKDFINKETKNKFLL